MYNRFTGENIFSTVSNNGQAELIVSKTPNSYKHAIKINPGIKTIPISNKIYTYDLAYFSKGFIGGVDSKELLLDLEGLRDIDINKYKDSKISLILNLTELGSAMDIVKSKKYNKAIHIIFLNLNTNITDSWNNIGYLTKGHVSKIVTIGQPNNYIMLNKTTEIDIGSILKYPRAQMSSIKVYQVLNLLNTPFLNKEGLLNKEHIYSIIYNNNSLFMDLGENCEYMFPNKYSKLELKKKEQPVLVTGRDLTKEFIHLYNLYLFSNI